MKLRIKGNSLRFRMTQSEVDRLASGESVVEKAQFSPIDSLTYAIKPWHLNVAEARFENNLIEVLLPEAWIGAWHSSNENSVESNLENGTETGLKILVEKDYVCLKERIGEDESDNFPHPFEGEIKC